MEFRQTEIEIWRERRLPEPAVPAGYAALIEALDLEVPAPRRLFATLEQHRMVSTDEWELLTVRHAPDATFEGHLTFALKYEGLDLAVLKRLFLATGPEPVEAMVEGSPTGSYSRRVWFLYEWLLGEQVDLPNASRGRYVNAVDPEMQHVGGSRNSTRHRVRDNLPGTPRFCPMVFRTKALDEFAELDLSGRAREVVGRVRRDLLARTAAFLLLKDSKASYAIEGERPPQDRVQRWGRAIGEAGRVELDRSELLRLQKIVIGDARFVRLGIRDDDGFVGEHDRETRAPIPVHISARPDDLPGLVDGLLAFATVVEGENFSPVVAAAMLAFGFVYIHPFYDGNGRIHRFLIHHVLARRDFHPPGIVFPVSAAILDRIDEYQAVLESYSARLLPVVRWTATEHGNVEVHNDTGDFYRFFDATPHAEFLFRCVRQTIEEDLPAETEFLQRYDEFRRQVQLIVEMSDSTVDLLFRFLDQNAGELSKRARTKEFAALTDDEVERVEALYARTFRG